MKLQLKTIIIISCVALAVIIPFLVYLIRSPVLIVTDQAFIQLYGEARSRWEQRNSSISLFRKVKTVSIANDAADDIVKIAISELSSRPYCVIFPLRFARAARLYREENARIPVILLEGMLSDGHFLSALGESTNDYFIYQTDIDSDFYRTGVKAAAFTEAENERIVVLLDSGIPDLARSAFLRGINSLEKPPNASFHTSASEFIDNADISCVVLAGATAEYFERETEAKKPVILFTWINPLLLPDDVVIVVNDSPWVQSVRAVRMAKSRMANGKIQSKFQVINRKNIDRETLRKIQK